MDYDYYSKEVCWLHAEEVLSITPGDNAGIDDVGIDDVGIDDVGIK